jgi:epoxyqueuosine reductase
LALLAQRLQTLVGGSLESYAAVDTAPLLERELARSAGMGFIGKNTMLITPGIGSYTVLGFLLLSIELPADEPLQKRCGSLLFQ